MSEKGFDPTLSLIILAVIIVCMVGFAWFWFNGVGNVFQKDSSEQNQIVYDIEKRIIIENTISGVDSVIILKNVGSLNVSPGEIRLYLEEQPQPCPGIGTLMPQNTVTCVITAMNCKGQRVRVESPGGMDEKTCN